MFRQFFGENYANKVDIFQTLYLRIVFLRGWLIDIPLLTLVCYFTPWEKFYSSELMSAVINIMEPNVRNISENKINSDFPNFSVSFLSVVHLFGLISLVFPFLYVVKLDRAVAHFNKNESEILKGLSFGIIAVVVTTASHLYMGAGSFFGCYKCSYHSQLSLVSGAIRCWFVIHYFLMITIVIYKAFLFIKRSEQR